jgi:glycosyltransferase involved in cell wall biosynthesis
VPEAPLPSFDLIVATTGRTAELAALLDSLRAQTHRAFRVVVVDQNGDDRLHSVLDARAGELRIERIESARGLSRARNAGLALVSADVVAFPDDDCLYPADLLERVARRLVARSELGGVTGRTADARGASAAGWGASPRRLAIESVWHGGNSASTFLRRETVETVGSFDESLGLGSGSLWSSGEEIDYLVRALVEGVSIEYDPDLVVLHELRRPDARSLAAVGRRDGASVGYILRKHRLPPRTVARMLVRPLGGIAVSLARGDAARARFHAETLLGRIQGYVGGRSGGPPLRND